jgi:hypothetical protein
MAINSLSTGFRPGVCTSSTRPTAPYEGQQIYETDTDLSYVWGGAAWQQVSGGTAVGNSGLVYVTEATATSGTTLNVNNCFTSTYASYVLVIAGLPTAPSYGIDLQMRLSTTNTITGYYWGMTRVDIAAGTSSVIAGNNSSVFASGAIAGTSGRATSVMQVINPQLAQYTAFSSQATDSRGSGAYGGITSSGQLTNTTQYDGFSLSFATGSGTISNLQVRVYGYRQV